MCSKVNHCRRTTNYRLDTRLALLFHEPAPKQGHHRAGLGHADHRGVHRLRGPAVADGRRGHVDGAGVYRASRGPEVFGLSGLIVGPVIMSLAVAVLRLYAREQQAASATK